MSQIGPGTLKCVLLSDAGAAADAGRELERQFGATSNIRRFGSALLVHTEDEPSRIRDYLRDLGSVIVMEFEKWSGYGTDVPREWLLARGH
jgi:hypothetical protein